MRRQGHLLSYIVIVEALTWLLLVSFPLPCVAQQISADNTSRYIGNGRWDWTVFIKASKQVLDDIECVEYTLHPTFPNPIRRECSLGDPRYPFGHSTNGWGTFEIHIKVTFKDGTVRFLKHMLILEAPPN